MLWLAPAGLWGGIKLEAYHQSRHPQSFSLCGLQCSGTSVRSTRDVGTNCHRASSGKLELRLGSVARVLVDENGAESGGVEAPIPETESVDASVSRHGVWCNSNFRAPRAPHSSSHMGGMSGHTLSSPVVLGCTCWWLSLGCASGGLVGFWLFRFPL